MRADRGNYGTLPTADPTSRYSSADRLDVLDDPKQVDLDGIPKFSFFKEQVANAVASSQQRPVARGPSDLDKGLVLMASCLLTVAVAVMSNSFIPLFESLRNAMSFSSFQIAGLSCVAPFFSAVFAGPVSSFLHISRLWDVLAWCSLALALGTWVSTCAAWGSPLEYLVLGQLFVGVAIAMLAGVPSKLSTYWIPGEALWSGELLWAVSTFAGMALPFLLAPPLAGGAGLGRTLPSFLMWRAVLGTGVAALVVAMRAGVTRSESEGREEEEETLLYRHAEGSKGYWATAYEVVSSKPLMLILLSLSLAMGVVFSFFITAPLLLSLPPHSLTPLQAGWALWPMGLGGMLGVVAVRSSPLFGLGNERRFRPVLLWSVAGTAGFLLLFVLALGRTGVWALTVVAALVGVCVAPLPLVLHYLVSDFSSLLSTHLAAAAAACVSAVVISSVPVASVALTHPFVAEYPTDQDSPTGFLLSAGCVFWLLLLLLAWLGVWLGYHDDEERLVVDANPHLIQHVTDRVASDLNEARALAEAVIPLRGEERESGGMERYWEERDGRVGHGHV